MQSEKERKKIEREEAHGLKTSCLPKSPTVKFNYLADLSELDSLAIATHPFFHFLRSNKHQKLNNYLLYTETLFVKTNKLHYYPAVFKRQSTKTYMIFLTVHHQHQSTCLAFISQDLWSGQCIKILFLLKPNVIYMAVKYGSHNLIHCSFLFLVRHCWFLLHCLTLCVCVYICKY